MGEAFTASCKQLEDELRERAGKCNVHVLTLRL